MCLHATRQPLSVPPAEFHEVLVRQPKSVSYPPRPTAMRNEYVNDPSVLEVRSGQRAARLSRIIAVYEIGAGLLALFAAVHDRIVAGSGTPIMRPPGVLLCCISVYVGWRLWTAPAREAWLSVIFQALQIPRVGLWTLQFAILVGWDISISFQAPNLVMSQAYGVFIAVGGRFKELPSVFGLDLVAALACFGAYACIAASSQEPRSGRKGSRPSDFHA